jgi:hypothetical protein
MSRGEAEGFSPPMACQFPASSLHRRNDQFSLAILQKMVYINNDFANLIGMDFAIGKISLLIPRARRP